MISDKIVNDERLNVNMIIIAIILLTVLFSFLTIISARVAVDNPQQRIESINVIINGFSAVTSAMLTLGLVYLYYKMSKISEGQKEIAERQVSLEEAQNKPRIIVEDVKYTDDHIALKITNEGTGLAKDFHIRCDAFSYSLGDDSSEGWNIHDLFTEDTHGFQITPRETKLYQARKGSINGDLKTRRFDSQLTDRNILRPSDSAWYRHRGDLGWMTTEGPPQSSGRHGKSFSDTMTTLDGAGIEKMCFQITLIFSDISDSLDAQSIIGIPIEVDSNLSVEQAINQPRSGVCKRLEKAILKDVRKTSIVNK